MKIQIENLKAQMQGRKLNIYQKADALIEFNKLLDYVEELEQCNIANVTQRLFDEVRRQEEELFTTALRVMAEPPIKGEITKGKIRWRGIRLIRQQVGLDSYSWLEQRGKQISPKFHIEAKLPDLNVG